MLYLTNRENMHICCYSCHNCDNGGKSTIDSDVANHIVVGWYVTKQNNITPNQVTKMKRSGHS
jgi:hypothetical protein